MKKAVAALCVLLGTPALAGGPRDAASGWAITNVAVSTTTVTAIPTTALAGRFHAVIQNLSPLYVLYIGTSTAMTRTNSYAVSPSSDTLELPLPKGLTIYGLGEATEGSGTVDVRIIQFK